jgi:hypothetical protein
MNIILNVVKIVAKILLIEYAKSKLIKQPEPKVKPKVKGKAKAKK